MFSVLSSAIEARSTNGTKMYSVDRLERKGGERGGGWFLTILDTLLI